MRVVMRISTGRRQLSDMSNALPIISYASCCDEGSNTGIIANLP